MNFKKFFSKNATLKIAALAIAGLGLVSGLGNGVSQEEFDSLVNSNKKVSTELDLTIESFSSLTEEVTSIESKKDILTNELSNLKLKKQEEEKRLEQERLERERLAKIEKEKEQEKIASIQSNNTSNTSSNNSDSSSSTNSSTRPNKPVTPDPVEEPVGQMVWKTRTGKKYHSTNNCGNTNSSNASKVSLSNAKSAGLTACSKCY